jgi:hypothetical protein
MASIASWHDSIPFFEIEFSYPHYVYFVVIASTNGHGDSAALDALIRIRFSNMLITFRKHRDSPARISASHYSGIHYWSLLAEWPVMVLWALNSRAILDLAPWMTDSELLT